MKHSIVATSKRVPCLLLAAAPVHSAGIKIIYSLFHVKCIWKVHWDPSCPDNYTLRSSGICHGKSPRRRSTKNERRSPSNKCGLMPQGQQGTPRQSTHKEENGTRTFMRRSFRQGRNTHSHFSFLCISTVTVGEDISWTLITALRCSGLNSYAARSS